MIPKEHLTENYKPEWHDLELTDEETEIAMNAARKEKFYLLKTKKHIEKINKKIEVPNVTSEILQKLIIDFAKKSIPDFEIDSSNIEIFRMLCLYFSNDPEFEKTHHNFALRKGIILAGPVGCGKTTLLNLFKRNTVNSFNVHSCREIAGEYTATKDGGYEVIEYYSNLSPVAYGTYFDQTHIGTCFDDLGTESAKKHFGNQVNIMEDIILARYDRGIRNKTHFTTNLSADEIEEMYGQRVKSRLREVCNFMTFETQSTDRRK